MKANKVIFFIYAVIILSINNVEAGVKKAPDWLISEWINGRGVELSDLKGKVVIIDFFQLWCPGCNKFTIPLMKKWNKTFHKELKKENLIILSIHTVFEGHSFQNPDRLKSFVKEKGIEHLVGIDYHQKGERIPVTMKRYKTRGTPEVAIIDKRGNIRFQIFGYFDTDKAENFIRELLKEPLG